MYIERVSLDISFSRDNMIVAKTHNVNFLCAQLVQTTFQYACVQTARCFTELYLLLVTSVSYVYFALLTN